MPASQWNLEKLLPEIAKLPTTWALIPVGAQKFPPYSGWEQIWFDVAGFHSAASEGVFKGAWVRPRDESPFELPEGACRAVGVLCGEPSGGLLFLDHDGASCDRLILELSRADSLAEALPKTAVVRSGRKGRYQAVYQVPRRFWEGITTRKLLTGPRDDDGSLTKVLGDDGKPEQLEFRWTGAQSVVLGHHPQTGGYEWVYHPAEVAIAEAPLWMIEQMLIAENEDESQPKKTTWTEFERSFSIPCSERIPLEIALAPSTRKALAGDCSKGRNDTGIQIAKDLLGVASMLENLGQRFEGNPETIFFDWCRSVGLDKDSPKGQPQTIWKSAQKGSQKPSLSLGMIEGCIKGYVWKQGVSVGTFEHSPKADAALEPTEIETEATPEALKNAIAELSQESDPFAATLKTGAIKRKFHLSSQEVSSLRVIDLDESPIEDMGSIIDSDFLPMLDEAGTEKGTGYKTGFDSIDNIAEGLKRKQLIILGARPGMGKSVLAGQMALNIARAYKKPVVFFSLEMEKRELLCRLVAAESGIPESKIRNHPLSQEEETRLFTCLDEIRKIPLFIDDRPRVTMGPLKERILKTLSGEKPSLVVIDYLQLLTPDRYYANANERVSYFSRELKILAGEMGCPVLALSQLNRECEAASNKRPAVAHLRDSGAVEQDAGLILLMYRDEKYNPDTSDKGIAEVIIGKNRHGGTGTARLLFEPEYTRFRSVINLR